MTTATKKKIKCEPSTRPNWQIEKQQEHTDRDRYWEKQRKSTLISWKCVFFFEWTTFHATNSSNKNSIQNWHAPSFLQSCVNVIRNKTMQNMLQFHYRVCWLVLFSSLSLSMSLSPSFSISIYLSCLLFVSIWPVLYIFSWKYSIFL